MDTELFAHLNPSPAEAASDGPLAGKAIVIWPSISVRGWPAEAGSTALKGFVALEDATVVERLKKAGAALNGNSRMSELGFGLAGDTAALILERGSADAALVVDTLGEARAAAARVRRFGFKPTHGTISRCGLIGLIPSMECVGILADSPAAISRILACMAGLDERDPSMLERPAPDFPRASEARGVVGVIQESEEKLSPEASAGFQQALSKLESRGFRIIRTGLADFDLFSTVHNVVGSVEASSSCGKYDGVRYGHRAAGAKNWNEMYLGTRAESFGFPVKSYLFQGAYFQFENYGAFENACRIRRRLVAGIEGIFKTVDMLAFPTLSGEFRADEARSIEAVYDAFSLTLPASVTGHPALQIPGLAVESKQDFGLQLVGPYGSDAGLLDLADRMLDDL